MMGKARKLETEVRRVYSPNWAFLFGVFALTTVVGVVAMEPFPLITGILGASVVAHIAWKRERRWRDLDGGGE